MCGIAGIIGKKTAGLPEMLQLQHHRGPDYTGTYYDENFAALGHNRLSIIDLSEAANQPFTDISGRYHLVFNGEIYNYKELKQELGSRYSFKTNSDTEVLLAAYSVWGKACLARLNGMFSFAIWDSKTKRLFAARDRFGVKPFYYHFSKNQLYFSSEIKALSKVFDLGEPNHKTWANYFTYGSYGMPSETFYRQISQLPAGHFLEFSAGNLSIEKWYDFEERVQKINSELSFPEARDYYLALLKDSISLRFRADVPLGFNLSGGVDSSLLLALVNQFEDKKHIAAFSFYTGDARYDELPWVEKMIATTQNPLYKVKFNASEVDRATKEIAAIQDEPFGGIPTLAYAKLFKSASAHGIKVLLDGQRMDEQWAGYDYYFQKTNSTIQGTGKKTAFRPEVLDPDFAAFAEKPQYPAPFKNQLLNLQYRDLFYTKIPRALRFNDRISMAYSTELREPFLDFRLVEFAFSQPKRFKYKNGIQKHLIREILKDLAPSDLTYAPKRPLQTPQREWLGEDLRDYTEEKITSLKKSSAANWFDFKKLETEKNAYFNGDNQSSFHIWQWINTAVLLE